MDPRAQSSRITNIQLPLNLNANLHPWSSSNIAYYYPHNHGYPYWPPYSYVSPYYYPNPNFGYHGAVNQYPWVHTGYYAVPPMTPLHYQIRKQIDYYFSDKNLEKDWFLKKQMNHLGWVDIRIVAGFPKVAAMTRDVDLVRQALFHSDVVELGYDGTKIRKRLTWKWFLPADKKLKLN